MSTEHNIQNLPMRLSLLMIVSSILIIHEALREEYLVSRLQLSHVQFYNTAGKFK